MLKQEAQRTLKRILPRLQEKLKKTDRCRPARLAGLFITPAAEFPEALQVLF
jgi:hypothetical protein